MRVAAVRAGRDTQLPARLPRHPGRVRGQVRLLCGVPESVGMRLGRDAAARPQYVAGPNACFAVRESPLLPPRAAAGLVAQRMAGVKHKLLVLSGKGGVGKSTVSAQLAFSLAHRGYSVGLLDVDICGPSIPRMLGLSGQEVHQSATGWSPVFVDDNLGVMSIGFMLPGSDDAIIWRGPRKNGEWMGHAAGPRDSVQGCARGSH